MSFDGHAIRSVLLKKPAFHVLNRQSLKKPFWPFQDHHWFLPLQGIWLRFGSFFGHGPSLTAEATAGDMAKGAAVPVMEAVVVRAVTATVEATY